MVIPVERHPRDAGDIAKTRDGDLLIGLILEDDHQGETKAAFDKVTGFFVVLP